MTLELINTGTELMLGRVLNTHQPWLCRQLADLGYEVARQVTVSDDGPAIQQAVREALARADLVITTGGLGPTSDDRTREVVAELLGRRLETNAVVLEEIRQFFTRRNRPQPRSTEVQALVPEGATILHNAHGTAPGLVLEAPAEQSRDRQGASEARPRASWLFLLPGPPRELRPMFTQQVVPLVQKLFPLAAPFVCRTLRTTGLGESQVEERIRGPLEALVRGGLEVGYCAATGAVDVRLAARGPQAAQQLAAGERILRELLGGAIYGEEDALLEQQVIRLLTGRGQTLVVAESCTGGLLGHRLTNVPGASAVFLGGCLTYSDEAKQTLLGVRPDTLRTHGAVSEPTAREMAEGVRSRLGADFALAVTGIAGPAGGTPAKPVGTVFIGLAAAGETVARSYFNPYDRETFKLVTSQQALDLLRQKLARCSPQL
jgi:nicotinamide-nucleotide amidase